MVSLPFADRVEAGRLLSKALASHESAHLLDAAVVVALTRGGVPVGFEVADRLRLPLEIIVVRKLGVPWQPELAMGAITGATRILDNRMIRQLGISDDEVQDTIEREQVEMRRREELYREGRQALDPRGRTVILVDDGLATGSTMLAAAQHIRGLMPASVIVGVPVGSKEGCNHVRPAVDDLVCLAVPELFCAVGEWYEEFDQVTDDEVRRLLNASRKQLRAHLAAAITA